MSTDTPNQPASGLIVLIPGLVPPAEMLPPLLRQASLPALSRLLSRATRVECSGNLADPLYQAMGLTRSPDWPLAPLMLSNADGRFAEGYWLRADPVHLRADRDQLILVGSRGFPLHDHEADEMIDAFNHHFADDQLSLHRTDAKTWYLHSASPLDLVTVALTDAIGKPVNSRLPAGRDALHMHRLFNEIQMLLFDLPANRQREREGLPTINSIWCWGGGVLPVPAGAGRPQNLICQQPDWAAIARGAGWQVHALPDQTRALPETGWLLLDHLAEHAQYGDYTGWLDSIQQLDQQWLAPLLQQLGNGQRKQLEIRGSTSQGEVVCWRLQRRDLWYFWRNAPLQQRLVRTG